jgi:hypothetical protein
VNAVGTSWCPDQVPKTLPELTSYDQRVATCHDKLNYAIADEHWIPLTTAPVPQVHLWAAGPDGPRRQGRFPSGDLVRAVALNSVGTLHEGLDINWEFGRNETDPDYDVTGDAPATYCYGTLPLTSGVEAPMSCSNPLVQACGALAYASASDPNRGCDPLDQDVVARYQDNVKQACQTAPACNGDGCNRIPIVGGMLGSIPGMNSICDASACVFDVVSWPVNCAISGFPITGAIKAVGDTILSYANPLCVGLTGRACITDGYTIRVRPFTDPTVEHELEYNLSYGAGAIAGYDSFCGDQAIPGQCTFDFYSLANKLSTADGHLFVSLDQNSTAIGGYDSVLGPDAPAPQWAYPYAIAPGIFSKPSSIWARHATSVGTVTDATNYPWLRVLPQADIDAFNPSSLEYASGFRFEFLGDLITDCGHNPLHQEIQPPIAMALHASTARDMYDVERYSLFAWARRDFIDQTVTFDLWPPVPPAPGMKLQFSVLQSNHDGAPSIVLGDLSSAPPGKLVCAPYPQQGSNRIHCTFRGNSTSDSPSVPSQSDCNANKRMLPSCSRGIAGGLVELRWVP